MTAHHNEEIAARQHQWEKEVVEPLLQRYEATTLRLSRDLAELRQTTRLPRGVEEALRAIGYLR